MKPDPGHTALRQGRCSLPQQIYLITTTTAGRQPLFADWANACAACRTLTQPVLWRGSELLCWTLMPDHWHALIRVGEIDTLAGLISRVKSATARAVNRSVERKGRVWAKSFHDHALRAEEALIDVARYVVANPLRAGLCRSVRDYPYWDAVWLRDGIEGRAKERCGDRPHGGLLQVDGASASAPA